MSLDRILFEIFLILAGAQLAAFICRRIGQPAVVGEILVGVVLGPSVLGWITMGHSGVELSEPLLAFAELGVIVLMFSVGLETPIESVRAVGAPAIAVAVGGVVVPFLAGWGLMAALHQPTIEALFVATALVATSVGVTARVLGELGVLDRRYARIVLGAAVIDDVLGLLVLVAVNSLAKGSIEFVELAWTAALAALFIAAVVLVGPRAAKRAKPLLVRAEPSTRFLVSMVFLVAMAAFAGQLQLAPIIGAFGAGVVLAGEVHDLELTEQVEVLGSFLTPFFFVGTGAAVDVNRLGDPSTLGLMGIIVALALLSKFVGAGGAAKLFGQSTRDSVRIGVGMMPRGEVGIIVATIALGEKAIDSALFSIIVGMSVLTTLVVPPLLTLLARERGVDPDRNAAADGDADDMVAGPDDAAQAPGQTPEPD